MSSRAPRLVVYYDGECALCETVKRWLSRLDRSRSVDWTAYQSLKWPPLGLSWADLESAMWLDDGSGRPLRGFYAFRMLAHRLPPLTVLAPALWLPGMERAGNWAYGLVARNRCGLSSCLVRKEGLRE